jgi:hypothetical protein
MVVALVRGGRMKGVGVEYSDNTRWMCGSLVVCSGASDRAAGAMAASGPARGVDVDTMESGPIMQIARWSTFRTYLAAVCVLCCGCAVGSPLILPQILERAIATQSVRIASPSDGAVIEGTTAVVVEFALDPSRVVAEVELYVDGERFGRNPIRSGSGLNRTVFYLDTTRYGNGEHTLSAVAYDADNQTWFALSGVRVANTDLLTRGGGVSGAGRDSVEPTIEIVRPSEGSVLQGIVDILVAAGDNACNPMVTIFIDRKIKAMTNRPPYTWTWDTRLYPDGQHLVEAWAHDEAQNRSVARPVSVESANLNPLTGSEEVLDPGAAGGKDVEPGTGEEQVAMAPGGAVAVAAAGSPLVAGLQALTQGYRLAAGAESVVAVISPPVGSVPTAAVAAPPPKEEKPQVATPVLTNPLKTAYQGLAGTRSGWSAAAESAGPRAVTPTVSMGTAPVTYVEPTTVEVSETVAAESGAAAVVGPVTVPRIPLAGLNVSGPEPGRPVAVRPTAESRKPSPQPAKTGGNGVQVASANVGTKLTGTVVGTTGPRTLDSLFVVFDSTLIKFDVKPTVKEGMAVAPFRQIFEHTGGTVNWIHELKIVNAKNEKVDIEIKIGRRMALVNEDELMMALTPYIQEGRTMVPLSFIRDALGLKMEYDPSTGRVYLSTQ